MKKFLCIYAFVVLGSVSLIFARVEKLRVRPKPTTTQQAQKDPKLPKSRATQKSPVTKKIPPVQPVKNDEIYNISDLFSDDDTPIRTPVVQNASLPVLDATNDDVNLFNMRADDRISSIDTKDVPLIGKRVFPTEDLAVSTTFLTKAEEAVVDKSISIALAKTNLSVEEELRLAKNVPGIEFSLFSANVHLFPPIIHKLGSSYNDKDKVRGGEGSAFGVNDKRTLSVERAKAMGQALVKKRVTDPFDVIVLQEAWDKHSRDAFYKEIKNIYPYKMEDQYQSYLAYAGLDVIMGSGLAIYSRHPFQTVIGRDKKKSDHILEVFTDYRGDECFAHKGFLLVKVLKNGIPVYVVATHLQAGASDVDKKYMLGANRESTRMVAKKEMIQIRTGLAAAIMNDYYPTELAALLKSCQVKTSGVAGFFNRYVWDTGKALVEKVNRNITGQRVATTIEQKEMECLTQKTEEFIKAHPEFWQKAYVFLGGDFNIAATDDDYNDIVEVFGKNAQTIMKADEKGSTSYDNLSTGTRKDNYRIDHILSLGKTPIQKAAGDVIADYLANIVGGSFISDVFDHTHTDHVALEARFKLAVQ